MKRNKRTTLGAKISLAPLTEKILARMGPEGAVIHQRLLHYFQQQANPETPNRERER